MNRLLAIGAVTAVLLAGAATRADDPAPLAVPKARVRLHEAAQRHRTSLKIRFIPNSRLRDLNPTSDRVTVGLGPVELCALPSTEGRFRPKRPWRWTFKLRQPGVRISASLNTLTGTLRVKTRGVDLSEIAQHGPSDVRVWLDIAGQRFESVIDFAANGDAWIHRGPRTVKFPVVGDPGGGGDPDPGGGGGGGGGGGQPPAFSLTQVGSGNGYFVGTAGWAWFRDQQSYASRWSQLGGGGTPSAVNFNTHMVVLVWTGRQPTLGYGVAFTGGSISGGIMTVRYQETRPGPNCVVGQAVTGPWAMARVPKVAADPRFQADPVKFQTCP